MANSVRDRGWGCYAALALGVLLLAVAGYSGYVLYPRFDLPGAAEASLLALAAAAGVAAFFSPCSFPLLVTLLARPPESDQMPRPSLNRLLRFATAFSLGATLFLTLGGAAIALGLAPLFAGVTFTSTAGRLIRAAVGLALIALGLFQSQGRSLSLRPVDILLQPIYKVEARLRREQTTLRFGVYGFGYILAGFG